MDKTRLSGKASDMGSTTIIQLHEARTAQELAPVLFKFIPEVLPCRMMFLMLRPLEFELRGFSSRPDLQKLCDDYITSDHKDDIWLKRSPMSPDIPVVRHSLYTPKEIFHASRFYKHVMLRVGCEYGCSLVAWRNDTWLGNVTLFRSEDQGDFRDDEMEKLNDCCLHFQSAILRIATVQEERLASKTLATLVWDLPTAAVVLDWNLKPLFWNASSHELISEWKHGLRRGSVKALRQFAIPPEIAESVEKAKESLSSTKPNRPKSPNMVLVAQVRHPKISELSADVSFVPSKSLAISKGSFVVIFHGHRVEPDERDSYDRLSKLTRRERDVALKAAAGKNSRQISQELGTSSVTVRKQLHTAYGKLGISSRYELMAMFARNPLARKSAA